MSDQANRDQNHVTSLLATSSVDGTSTVKLYADPITHRLLIDNANTTAITGLISAGTNVTITGSGTTISPYVINSTGGGTPGGSTTQVQFNNAGVFGGSSKITFDGTQLLVQNLESILYADQFTGSGNNDIGDKINTAYAALASTGGVIRIPAGIFSFSTPIIFGTNGKFITLEGTGAASTILKFTPTSGNAITINDGNPIGHLVHEITRFTLQGKSALVAAGQTNTNTSIGIFYGGNQGAVGINTHDTNINGFGTNWEIGANAYMLAFNNNANSGGNGGQAARGALLHIDVASNSGERNIFEGNAFTDPGNSLATNAIYISNAGTATNFFTHNSFDDVQIRVGSSDGSVILNENHWENSAFGTYPQYIPLQGVVEDLSTMITFNGNGIANDGNSSSNTFQTIIQHGGQLVAFGNQLNNYGGQTVTNFVDHSLDNGKASDMIWGIKVQGGGLTNIVAGSGGVPWTEANSSCPIYNVENSYTIGLRANPNNTNEFFSGSNVTGSFDHSGNWILPALKVQNFDTVLDATQFSGSDIGAQINAAYAFAVSQSWKGVVITIPVLTASFSTPIVIGNDGFRATIRGIAGDGTYLTYTGSNSTVAITINCGFQGDGAGSEHITYTALQDITLKGNDGTSASAKIGVYLGGTNGAAGAVLRNVKIETFGQCLVFGANTYHTLCDSVVLRNGAQLLYITAPSNSGESLRFINCFFVDPFDTTYVTANGVQIADSGTASASFFGCSFDDTQVRIGQANNVSFYGTHWENPGSANWGAYTYLSIDNNLATNVSLNGDTFFATGSTSPTAYFANGGNLTMNAVIVRKFTGSAMTNMGSLTGTGRVTWSGLNNVSGTAITNVVSGVPYAPSGFTTQAGAYQYLDNNAHSFYWATNTTTGTTGAQTINKTSGTVNFAAAATSLVVTNSLVTTSSIIFAVIRTNDTTALLKNVVPGSGSFTITLNAAATAETSVGFWVVN